MVSIKKKFKLKKKWVAEAGNKPSLFARCCKVLGPSSVLPSVYWLYSDTLGSATAFYCLPQGVPPRSQPSLTFCGEWIYIYTPPLERICHIIHKVSSVGPG